MSDLKIIKDIEKELAIKLHRANKINTSGCYTLNSDGQVTGLGLRSLKITSLQNIINPISKLKKLSELDFGVNNISDISFLKDLNQLEALYLDENHLSNISILKDLIHLKRLNLSSNPLRNISELACLKNLTDIYIHHIPSLDLAPMKELSNLEAIYACNGTIKDILQLRHFKKLKKLYIGNNFLTNLLALKDLTNLEHLYLDKNKIEDISALENLSNLAYLSLKFNPIKKLPSWVTDFKMEILWIDHEAGEKEGSLVFWDNPLISPPVEIVKQGKGAIRDYFRSLEDEEKVVTLNEVKVILVGDGMAGKTSLLKQLQGFPFDKKESQTHGINVVSLNAADIKGLKNVPALKDCKLHCWDFGGQEIMHASHQFFLSERALYILVLDSRTDSKKYHWLKHIEKYGGDSPVIVVINKVDENHSYNVEQNKLNKEFPNIENRFHRISCKKGNGITELIKTIGETIPQTSLFGTDINKDWLHIKGRLVEETGKNLYLDHKRFVEICEENNVADTSSQHTLLKYLDNLGLVLYFEQLDLADIYVLDPHWVTIGVYKIINSSKTKNGILKEKDLDYILNKEKIKSDEYDPAKEKKVSYSLKEQCYIVHIMEEFELCYEYDKEKKHYIIPDLLQKELTDEPELTEGTPLCFIMKYDYLPSPIISRLMLQLKNDIEDGLQWKYGMVISNQYFGCRAKVRADAEKKTISITVQGEFHRKREYFSAIRHHLSSINGEFDNLLVDELMPLPGFPDHFAEYRELLGFEKAGKDEYFVGKLGKTFSVSEMLDSVISKEERTNEGRVGDIIIKNELSNIGNPRQSVETFQKVDIDVKVDIKVELPAIQGEFEEIKEFLAEALADGKEKEKAKELGDALDAVTPKSDETKVNGALNKAKRFLDKLADDKSDLNKMIKGAAKGAEYAKKAGVLAAKIALLLGV